MDKSARTSRLFNFISACLAFLLWGGWAYYINTSDSNNYGTISAIAQGTASFLITIFMVHVVTFLFHRFEQPLSKMLLPAIITVSFTSTCLVIIHLLIGTPHIFITITPAHTIAVSFFLFTYYNLLTLH